MFNLFLKKMVQNYVQYSQTQSRFQTLKPNVKKIFLKNLFNIISAVLLVIIVLLIFHWQVGLDFFLDLFEIFGVSLNPSTVLLYLILAIVGITIFHNDLLNVC